MKASIAILLLINITLYCDAQSTKMSDFFEAANAFFKEYVEDGKVAYKKVKTEPAQLEELVRQIRSMQLDEEKSAENKAFLINTYNLVTIYSIIQNGLQKSPMDVEGFFDKQTHRVAGKHMTLDQIEKEMLLPVYKDSRLHFVLVCAALGCPPIKPYAYVPGKLDQQMEESTISTLNSDYFIRVQAANRTVLVSELFKWYKEDFLSEADSILAYINNYRKRKIPITYEVGYYTYDWSLNTQ